MQAAASQSQIRSDLRHRVLDACIEMSLMHMRACQTQGRPVLGCCWFKHQPHRVKHLSGVCVVPSATLCHTTQNAQVSEPSTMCSGAMPCCIDGPQVLVTSHCESVCKFGMGAGRRLQLICLLGTEVPSCRSDLAGSPNAHVLCSSGHKVKFAHDGSQLVACFVQGQRPLTR